MDNLEFGMVVEVDGFISKIATFKNFNHSTLIYKGTLVKNVSVNSFVIINQGFKKIIGRISSESIWDNLNKSNEHKLDNRFSKNSITRVIEVKTIGYIVDGKFTSGASYLPMIGNLCRVPTIEEINKIYINNYVSDAQDFSISIGKTLQENNRVSLPINEFFASHIGIFGNTGSGKSNTLHKLYYELFSLNNLPNMWGNSKFLVLDFNGEYVHDKSFGIKPDEGKDIYKLTTRTSSEKKFPIKSSVFFEEEMLSMIFSATQQTQRPFITRVLKGISKYGFGMKSLSNWIGFLYKAIFTGEANPDLRDLLTDTIERYIEGIAVYLGNIRRTQVFSNSSMSKFRLGEFYFNSDYSQIHRSKLKIDEILDHICKTTLYPLEEFEFRCHLQVVNDLLYRNILEKHISPLIRRIESRLITIEKYITIVEELPRQPMLQIISLKDLNQEAKKVLSMLVVKMYYDSHKLKSKSEKSFHLIIDEAHNILANEQNSWSDYRLDIFDEVIKEGRKFNFFLTLSSQRPADISPTILSQVHNLFLHKLVNELDLNIVNNSLSTLDRISKSMLPLLAQGVCIVTGTALTMPITIQVDFIKDEKIRPQSDTIKLTDIWKEKDKK